MILQQQCQVDQLSQRVKKLEDQVSKDSRNSGKPPSSDGLSQAKTRSLRRSEGRKPGGQKGHPGHTLALSEHPEHIEVHDLSYCPHCACDLSAVAASDGLCGRWESERPRHQNRLGETWKQVKRLDHPPVRH